MHNGVNAVQFDAKPRTGCLPKICTKRMQEAFNVAPTDLRWRGRTEDQFEGLSLLRVHIDKISRNDTNVNAIPSCIPRPLQRHMLFQVEIGINERGAEAIGGDIEGFDAATGDGGEE